MRRIKSDVFRDETFTWPVATAGYRWVGEPRVSIWDGTREFYGLGYSLFEVDQDPPTDAFKHYRPLEKPHLFETFAKIELNHDAMKRFADEWGLLGVNRGNPHTKVNYGEYDRYSEHEVEWEASIKRMRAAVELWQLALACDRRGLARVVTKGSRQVDEASGKHIVGWGYSISAFGATIPHVYPVDDVVVAGWHALNDSINANLEIHCSPYLRWDWEQKRSTIRVSPKNLLGAMWWQFAQRVIGEVQIKQCKVCGGSITISREGDGKRIDRELCSAKCRQAHHRSRIRDARRLQEEGLRPVQIAKKLQTSPEVIRNWLAKK